MDEQKLNVAPEASSPHEAPLAQPQPAEAPFVAESPVQPQPAEQPLVVSSTPAMQSEPISQTEYQVGWQSEPVPAPIGTTYSAQWNQPMPDAPVTPPPPKPQKPKKPMTAGKTVALCLVLCLAFSSVFGAVGLFLGWSLASGEESPIIHDGQGTVIYEQTPAPSEDSEDTLTPGADGYTVGQVAKIASPSVVEISTEQVTTGSFMQQYVQQGAGSGVIVSKDGYVVTNNHVIEGATTITVRTTTGKEYVAKLIGTDTQTDIAVIKVEASDLTPAVFGDSKSLQVGDMAVVIGNPLGELGGTVTDGIISALDREVTIDRVKMTLLQTNAAVNPGNSGGGLFDKNGTLVAVVNAKSSGSDVEGLGFAIPIHVAKPVIESLIEHGYVRGRTFMGITPVDILDNQTAMSYRVNRLGVYVLKVYEGSAAEEAGMLVGDCILSIDDEKIESASDVSAYLLGCEVGQTVTVKVYRDQRQLSLKVKLSERLPD